KDPNYALAYAGLAGCYLRQGNLFVGPRKTHALAKQNAEKAIELDDRLAEAHAALGGVYLFNWEWPKAEGELKKAIALDPNVLSQGAYGLYLGAMGRPAEALAFLRRTEELNPLAAPQAGQVALCYLWMGEYDRASAQAKKALAIDPNFFLSRGDLALAYTRQGKHQEALAELHRAVKQSEGHPRIRGLLGYAYAKAGQTTEARKELAELQKLSDQYGYSHAMARIHAALGEKDEAFQWLKQACEEKNSAVLWLKIDPTFENLRSHARFAQVLKEVGLPP